jgi:opacity protein-like surface antigen
MKNTLLLASLALALPAFAGTTATQVTTPAPEPSLWSWFVGGSVGYLVDADEVMYNGHIGVDTPWNLGGWNVALFLEGGYTQIDERVAGVDVETDIVPVTFDVKFERPLTGNLKAYVGGGLGAAFVDVSAPAMASEDDTVFAAQVFAGLNYNFCPSFEMYGGARWIYCDDVRVNGADYGLGDDWLLELGARFNF